MSILRAQVAEFHLAMDVPADATKPTIIPDDRVRLRASLIAEEFFETMASLFNWQGAEASHIRLRMQQAEDYVRVVEGTRLEFGIDGAPVASEVHRANMAKAGGPIAPNGKRLKPDGWMPGYLTRAQGPGVGAVKVFLTPIPMRLTCPTCGELHIDEGRFAKKPHHTHACQHCGAVWRPAVIETVGVRFLPGFKNS